MKEKSDLDTKITTLKYLADRMEDTHGRSHRILLCKMEKEKLSGKTPTKLVEFGLPMLSDLLKALSKFTERGKAKLSHVNFTRKIFVTMNQTMSQVRIFTNISVQCLQFRAMSTHTQPRTAARHIQTTIRVLQKSKMPWSYPTTYRSFRTGQKGFF